MEASGGSGSYEGDPIGTVDPANFGDFVDYVVSRFEVTRMPVDQSVIDYIKTQVLPGDAEWEQGVRNGKIDVTKTQDILVEALEASGDVADSVGQPTLDLTIAEPTFIKVVEGRWHCPFPFLIC